jgi:SNF2 family DNA or RNA helicase
MRPLRKYQRDIVSYCLGHQNPILWVEMRLGKTVSVIRAIKLFENARNILVVAPNSALRGWQRELSLDHEEDVVLLQGNKSKRRELFYEGHKWALINKEGYIALPEIGTFPWSVVVLDESASAIRYPKTKITTFFLKNFKRAQRRIVMAGRPDPQNRLLDYWPQMAFAHGGQWMGCTNYYQFRNRFFFNTGYEHIPKAGARKRVLKEVSRDAFVLRREHVNLEVPKVFEERSVLLPAHLRKVYERAENEFCLETPTGDKFTKWSLVKYGWLRQLAGGFVDGKLTFDGKIRELIQLLFGELAGEKVVVWFAFNQELHAVRRALGGTALWVDGSLPIEERKNVFRCFSDGVAKVLLCQIKAAETGEDLSAADTAIYYSAPFGVLSWSQTQDRILGDLQKRGVLIISMIAEDTVDGDILRVLQSKDTRGSRFLDMVHEEMLRRRTHGDQTIAYHRSRKLHRVGVLGKVKGG